MSLVDLFEPYELPEGALPVRCHLLSEDESETLEEFLVEELPGCYVTAAHVRSRVAITGKQAGEILANRLPDRGNVMSGDFGEILSMFFLSSERAERTFPVKKWRYKQDFKKSAPHSDVIILHRQTRRRATTDDFVICAEVKQKATPSKTYIPIESAVASLSVDRTGRLGRALVWLREKAVDQESADRISYLNRFTVDPSVEYSKHFKAVAIIDRDLLDEEVCRNIDLPPQGSGFEVLVIGIADLKDLYETVFERAVEEYEVE